MSKPLVFCNAAFTDKEGNIVDTWELFNIGGGSAITHAMWDPRKLNLVCQYESVKENLVDYPQQSKSGKVTWSERKLQQYFTAIIKDHDAIKYILENFVGNYNGQDFVIKYESPVKVQEVDEFTYRSGIEEIERPEVTKDIESNVEN